MKNFSATLFFALWALAAQSQSVRLVRDLNPGKPNGFDLDSYQSGIFACLGQKTLIFLAKGESDVRLICRSDGTSQAGTYALLPPLAANDSFGGYVESVGLFWFIINGGAGANLYSTDGTWNGTQLRYTVPIGRLSLLRSFAGGVVFAERRIAPTYLTLGRFDLAAGTTSSVGTFEPTGGLLDLLTVGDSIIYGIGANGLQPGPRQVFKSHGQANDIQNVFSFPVSNVVGVPAHLTLVGDKLFYFHKSSTSTTSLWRTDLTQGSHQIMADVNCAETYTTYHNPTAVAFNGQLIFTNGSSQSPTGELWASDGTPVGTRLLKNLDNDIAPSLPRDFTEFEGKLYFSNGTSLLTRQLWVTDGTSDGTQRVYPDYGLTEAHGQGLAIFHDSLVCGGLRDLTGAQILRSKGDEASAVVAADFASSGFLLNYTTNFRECGRYLFFINKEDAHGNELWVYDPLTKQVIATQEPDFQPILKISPNPGGQFCRVELPESATGQLQVFSATGQLILEKTTATATEILNANDWPPGAYLLKFISEKNAAAGRWVKASD